jgi:hypothetical protein
VGDKTSDPQGMRAKRASGDRVNAKSDAARGKSESDSAKKSATRHGPVPGDDYEYGYPAEYGSSQDDNEL